jgi:OmcA/MtrC family decaheme c-type cytochrome
LPALLLAVLALGGCLDDGDDGAQGPQGEQGIQGEPGEPGGALDAQALFDLGLHEEVVALNPQLDLSRTVAYDAATGVVTAHFFLTDGTAANNGIDLLSDAYELRFYVAELIDNADGTDGQSWDRLIYESGTPADPDPDEHLPGTLTQIDAATGEYTYAFADTLPASGNVFRVTARARWREDVFDQDGVRSRIVFANPVNANYDFLQADPGTELASSGADIVATEACESCHGARIGNVGHGGGYTKVKTCNNCHNVNYMSGNNRLDGDLSYVVEGDLAYMIHRIHNAGSFVKLDDGIDFSHLTYPQHINTCGKCHTDAALNSNLAYEVVTRSNCSSCHDINFATGEGHGGGGIRLDDTQCTTCHTPGVVLEGVPLDPIVAHDDDRLLAKKPENISEYEVTIEMTPPGDGRTFYIAGEAPEVTVTLAGGNLVDYEANQDAEGDTDGVLSEAELFVYGPRSNAVPVLTTNSTTDGGNQQGVNLLKADEGGVANPDVRVTTGPGGYMYQLQAIPADLPAGTYMVRFEGLDYGTPGAPSVPEYVTASSAVINFQVGTAEVEPKVSGDACTNCHGDTIMHLEGAHPHHQAFDTDGCLGCHDLSENYADYIGNRAHAVHSASLTGDLHLSGGMPRNWSHVTFPRPANNCRTCHTNSEAAVPVWRDPNEVACGGCHGTDYDAIPANYPDDPDTQADLLAEIAAATHMLEMGGTFLADTTNPYDPNYVARQCIVCHGEDRIADLFETHGLVNFPVAETEVE